MHGERLIPSGFDGKFCKIKIQNSEDRYPFTYYGVALHEDDRNFYVRMGETEIFFRKEHIYSIEFPKSDHVTIETDREAKVICRLGQGQKTQVVYGPISSETDSYYFVELIGGKQRCVPKDSVISISFSKPDAPDKKKDWTDRKPMRTKPNEFSYSRWWKDRDVKECDNK